MSDDVIIRAIQKLQEDLQTLLNEVQKKKQAINVLFETIGEDPPYKIEGEPTEKLSLRRDQFFGKAFATAATEFLEMKKEVCSAEEIMKGLEEGGFDFPWDKKDRLRSVAISLAKNSVAFQRLPNGTFGLVTWYPDRKKEPQKRTGKIGNGEGSNREEGQGEKNQQEQIDELIKNDPA